MNRPRWWASFRVADTTGSWESLVNTAAYRELPMMAKPFLPYAPPPGIIVGQWF